MEEEKKQMDDQPVKSQTPDDKPKEKRERKPKNKTPKEPKDENSEKTPAETQKKESRPQTAGEPKEPKKQYRKKAEKVEGEEEKVTTETPTGDEQPKTEKRGRGGRGRGGDRPNTSRPLEGENKKVYRKKGEAPAEGEEVKEVVEGEEQKETKKEKPKEEVKKNLIYQNPMNFTEKKTFRNKYEEWKYGDWKKGSGKTFVTLETEIPEPPKKQLEKPEEVNFHSKIADIDEKIKVIDASLKEKEENFKLTLDNKRSQQKAGDTGIVVSKELGQKFTQMKELKKERNVHFDEQEKVTAGLSALQNDRDYCNGRIDRIFKDKEDVPKGIKQANKEFQTSSSNDTKKEKEHIKRIKFLNESLEYIEQRDGVKEKIDAIYAAKKKISAPLSELTAQVKKLQVEIDELKKTQTEKLDAKEGYDKQLDKINEKRKKDRDDRDKLYKQKDELRNVYYGALIEFTKQDYLLADIKWMTDMQGKLSERKVEKEKRDEEYRQRREKIQKERDEKKKREEERKQRDLDKIQKQQENKKLMEEQLKQSEVDAVVELDKAIEDMTLGKNPLFEQIQQCEQLKKYCQTKISQQKGLKEEKDETPTAEQLQKDITVELQKALVKGSIMQAPSRDEKNNLTNQFSKLKSNKGKKSKKASTFEPEGSIDFIMIKKFNALKLSAPLEGQDFEKTIQDLDELKEALIYWGKIIQRQNKIKYIRNARKISSNEEYKKAADEEEIYIKNEKSKFMEQDESTKSPINPDKLKTAQDIDRELRMNKVWEDEQMSDDSEEEKYTADDMGDEENPAGPSGLQDEARRGRGGKTRGGRRDDVVPADSNYYKKPRQSQRPSAKKFKDIMNDDAFPTLPENQGSDVDDDMDGEVVQGDINSVDDDQ